MPVKINTKIHGHGYLSHIKCLNSFTICSEWSANKMRWDRKINIKVVREKSTEHMSSSLSCSE